MKFTTLLLDNYQGEFQKPMFSVFFNSDWKFVFLDKNWVGKMPHKSFFGQNTQIFSNKAKLGEKDQ